MGDGDLLNLLIERDVFEGDFSLFYVVEVRGDHWSRDPLLQGTVTCIL